MTSSSLVVRLTAIVAGIVTLAFAAGALIVHRSTASTYRQVQRDVQVRGDRAAPAPPPIAALEDAYRLGGWDAVRAYAANDAGGTTRPPTPFLVLDAQNQIAAASSPGWQGAVVRAGPNGSFRVTAEVRRGKGVDVQELATTNAADLTDANGVWGRLIVLPDDEPAAAVDPGQAFAARFWRTAAAWLAGVLLVAVGAIVWAMRQSLAPIAELTKAARQLHAGGSPVRLSPHGAAEFRDLVNAFNAAAESIARTERLRRDLVSDIAHELRTPLTNVRGQLEALQAGLVRPDSELIATLQNEVKLLERLVSDFHQLALSDAGQITVHPQPLPLRETIEQLAAPLVAAADGRLAMSGPPDVWCLADEERLRQVLGNLVENSARHQPDGLAIDIAIRDHGPWATFAFQDNGPGVAESDRPHIFDRFYRAEKSRNRATGGAGLGLTIVRGLLQAMGGTIRYEAVDGAGATFIVDLPATTAPGPGA
jgi:signal transduction histidine kinase